MYNTILVPTDLAHEEDSIKMLKRASVLSNNGRIVLLHVLDAVPAFATTELPADILEQQQPRAEQALEELVKKSAVNAEVKTRKGRSYNRIINEAKEINADLILINSHKPGLRDYLLGSTAAKVVRHATCSVLVSR